MWARSASASDGSRWRAESGCASVACRNSTSAPRITRPGDDSAARATVLSSSRMLPGQWYCSSRSDRFLREALAVERQPVGRAVAAEEALRQHRNVAGALAERRQPDREGVDAVVEILAEPGIAHELIERPIGRRDQPEVDLDRLVARRAARTAVPRARAAAWPAPMSARSPISSRNSVPLFAISSRPGLRSFAPVNAPFS